MDHLAEYVETKCYLNKHSLICNMSEHEAKEHLTNICNRVLHAKDHPSDNKSSKSDNSEKLKIVEELIRLNELKLSLMN